MQKAAQIRQKQVQLVSGTCHLTKRTKIYMSILPHSNVVTCPTCIVNPYRGTVRPRVICSGLVLTTARNYVPPIILKLV